MRFSTEYAKRFGDAVLKTRIGLSYTDPTASCSLVGPETYREFIKPYHQDMVNYFKAKKVGTTIHICGTTHQIHEDLVDVGFVAITIDLDQQADPTLKVDQLDKLVTLGNARGVVGIGNVDATIFERATKAEIEAEVKRCIDTVGKRSRFATSCVWKLLMGLRSIGHALTAATRSMSARSSTASPGLASERSNSTRPSG
jgi:uroporphyrinogen decarboxylase